MNYHIICQDKFFESYIEDIYRVNQEDNNVIWVRGNKGDSRFFKTNHPVEYLGNEASSYKNRLQTIKPEDKLFVCWYDTFIGNLILQTGVSAPLYVYLMGAEFYAQPEWWHEEWLLDTITKRKIKKERLYATYLPLAKPWRWYRWFSFKKNMHEQYAEKLKTIKRIDYLILPEHATDEIKIVKKLYPGFRAKHKIGTFDQNFDLSKCFPTKIVSADSEPVNILLGNSSDPNGNQMDAISYLKKNIKTRYEIYCVLSYGDREVYKWICDYGKKELGEHFHPVTDFMGREQFIEFLNSMDVALMYHNRQQAAGTIMTALTLGKPVFLKEQNPLLSQLKYMGIKSVYDVKDISRLDLKQVIREAQEGRNETQDAINKEYGESTRLCNLKKLLEKEQ